MRRSLLLLMVLCVTPAADAQTRWIVGNTLIDVPPGLVLADARGGHGKGHGHGRGGGGGAPAPSPSPAPAVSAPAPQPAGEMGRGEASFQHPYGGSVVIAPVAQAQPVPAPSMSPGPTLPQYRAQPACPECGATITVPVQLQLRAAIQALPAQVQVPAAQSRCP